MDQVVTTVCFDGQFWIAFIEKTNDDGILSVGKHTFGAEPSNPELVAFMLGAYALVPVYPSDVRVRIRARKSPREQERSTNKAKLAFSESQKAYFAEVKKSFSKPDVDDARRYAMRQEKKKEKRRGH
jgi:Protein of unknown function (DUF2992).